MLPDCNEGRIDIILTKSISRFARNTVGLLNTVRDLRAKGISIRFEKENIWTFDSKGELLLTIMPSLVASESYRAILKMFGFSLREYRDILKKLGNFSVGLSITCICFLLHDKVNFKCWLFNLYFGDWRCVPELSRFAGMVIYLLFKDNKQHNKPHVHVYYG